MGFGQTRQRRSMDGLRQDRMESGPCEPLVSSGDAMWLGTLAGTRLRHRVISRLKAPFDCTGSDRESAPHFQIPLPDPVRTSTGCASQKVYSSPPVPPTAPPYAL